MTTHEVLLWAFEQNYHTDHMNAAIHCAPVRFSPLTFRLCQALFDAWPADDDITAEMHEVRTHMGAYAEDKGR